MLFLGVNIVLFLVYIFLLSMLSAYFKQIHTSVLIYTNNKVYKSYRQIEFVKTLLDEYREAVCANELIENMEIYIKRRLHKDYIGKFRYSFIEECSLKVKWVMVCVVALQLIYMVTVRSTQHYLLISNVILIILVMVITIIRGMPLRKAEIILILSDYLTNQYNIEAWKNDLHQQEKQLGRENEYLKDTVEAQTDTIQQQKEQIELLETKLQMVMEFKIKESKSFAEYRAYPELKDKDIIKIINDMNF